MSGSRDDYDNVNMDMSDGSSDNESDNDMFANKAEYAAFKEHFNSKAGKSAAVGSSSAASGEYGGDVASEASEYGGGTNKISAVGNKFGQQEEPVRPSNLSSKSSSQSVMSVGDKKVERRPMLYGEDRKIPERDRRSKSKERRHRQRSKDRRRSDSREDKRRRSRSRDRRRSRSRSPYRGGRDHQGRHRNHDRRQRDREEGARNHEEQVRKAREMGVEMPKYLKPGAVNPLSYAEQMQKRKSLWAKPAAASNPSIPSEEEKPVEAVVEAQAPTNNKQIGGSYNNWESTNFGNDKVNEKFRRLMGIKGGGSSGGSGGESQGSANQGYDKIMTDLDRNYEAARQQTHRNRGIGLGFSNSGLGAPPPQPPCQEPQQPPAPSNNMFRNNSAPWQSRPTGGINFVRKN